MTVLAAPYRHSRVSGNPDRMMVLSTGDRGIPAYAGMTVGEAGMTVGGPPPSPAAPLSSGFPLTREGR